MTEIEIYGSGKKVSIPSSWSEMTPEQVRFVFRTYDSCLHHGASPLEFNIKVLYHFIGIRRTWRNTVLEALFPDRLKKISENIYRLCEECLVFLFTKIEDGDTHVRLSYDAVSNSLPEVRGRIGQPLIGPADLLQDLTFSEFRHAASAMNAFFRTMNVADLDECLAILYRKRSRKPNRAGRYVRDIDNRTMAKDIRRISKLPVWQKNLIMMWFANCLKYLQEGGVNIDGEEIDMSLMFSGDKENSSELSFTWNDLLVQIARDQSIGNIERVDEEPLFSIFSLMWSNYKENRRNEKIRNSSQGK